MAVEPSILSRDNGIAQMWGDGSRRDHTAELIAAPREHIPLVI